jgi:hypothetical protein
MLAPQILAVALAGVLFAGFAVNEMSHGAMAEMMGLGHRHMLDHGGYHCAEPTSEHWERHQSHMHRHDGDAPYATHCGVHHMTEGHGHRHGDGHRMGDNTP